MVLEKLPEDEVTIWKGGLHADDMMIRQGDRELGADVAIIWQGVEKVAARWRVDLAGC